MKKSLRIFCLAIALMLCVSSISCTASEDSVKLLDWEDQNVSAEYGSTYELIKYAYDSNGNRYVVTPNVFIGQAQVEVNEYRLEIESKADYKIVYSTHVSEKPKTVNLSVTERKSCDVDFGEDRNVTVLTAEDVSALGFAGEYSGPARKVVADSDIKTSSSVNIGMTADEFDKGMTDGYNYLKISFAVSSSTGKAVRLLRECDNGNNGLFSKDYYPELNTWKTVLLAVNNETRLKMFDEEGNVKPLHLFNLYTSCNKRIVNGVKTAMTLYVGELMFDEETRYIDIAADEIMFVHNKLSLDNFRVSESWKKTFKSSSEMSDITGDYDGNAVLVEGSGISLVMVTPRITEEQYDTAVAAGFNKMYVWVSGYADNGKPVKVIQDGTLYTGTAKTLINKTWTKLTFSLTEEKKDKLFADGGVRIFTFYMTAGDDRKNEDGTATTIHGYVGNLGFEKDIDISPVQADEITFVNVAGDTKNYFVMEKWSKTFKSSSELTNISGDYNGNAILVEGTGISLVMITPRITVKQYDAAVTAGYTKMYIWVSGYADNGKPVKVIQDGTLYTGSAKTLADRTWMKLTFELTEENKTKLFAEGGVRIFTFYMTAGDDRKNEAGPATTVHGYVGNFGFEK